MSRFSHLAKKTDNQQTTTAPSLLSTSSPSLASLASAATKDLNQRGQGDGTTSLSLSALAVASNTTRPSLAGSSGGEGRGTGLSGLARLGSGAGPGARSGNSGPSLQDLAQGARADTGAQLNTTGRQSRLGSSTSSLSSLASTTKGGDISSLSSLKARSDSTKSPSLLALSSSSTATAPRRSLMGLASSGNSSIAPTATTTDNSNKPNTGLGLGVKTGAARSLASLSTPKPSLTQPGRSLSDLAKQSSLGKATTTGAASPSISSLSQRSAGSDTSIPSTRFGAAKAVTRDDASTDSEAQPTVGALVQNDYTQPPHIKNTPEAVSVPFSLSSTTPVKQPSSLATDLAVQESKEPEYHYEEKEEEDYAEASVMISLIASPSSFATRIFERLEPVPSPIAERTARGLLVVGEGSDVFQGVYRSFLEQPPHPSHPSNQLQQRQQQQQKQKQCLEDTGKGEKRLKPIFMFDRPSPDDIVFQAQAYRGVATRT